MVEVRKLDGRQLWICREDAKVNDPMYIYIYFFPGGWHKNSRCAFRWQRIDLGTFNSNGLGPQTVMPVLALLCPWPAGYKVKEQQTASSTNHQEFVSIVWSAVVITGSSYTELRGLSSVL